MPFVKLDCGILNSTLWFEREAREVFLTALLMAEPFELAEPTDQIEVDSLESTGWSVPAGWYGFVPAAGVGIIHRAKVDEALGKLALKQLGSPEESSRSKEYDGRRLVRVNGGYIVLNYFKYRDRDYTAAERMRRLRARKKAETVTRNDDTLPRNVTQVESREQKADKQRTEKIKPSRASALDDFDAFWRIYPNRVGKRAAEKAWTKIGPDENLILAIVSAVRRHSTSAQWQRDGGQFIPHPASWLNGRRWEDELPVAPRPRTLGPEYADDDWFEDCKRLHDGTCNGRYAHSLRMPLPAGEEP